MSDTRLVFVPWPVPLALGLLVGVAFAAPVGRWCTTLGVTLMAVSAVLQFAGRHPWPTSLKLGNTASAMRFVLPVMLAAGLGLVRAAEFDRRLNPIEPLYGQSAVWRGSSDGTVLNAVSPVRAKLALVAPRGGWPGGSPPVGHVTIEGVAEPAPGKRNPGGFDYAAHLNRRGVSGQLFVQQVSGTPAVSPRHRVQRGVVAGLNPEGAALMSAITLGVRDDLGDLRDAFAASGMAHLLALSGLHIGVLLLSVDRLLKAVPRYRTPLVAITALGFVWLVGASPSVVRAASMALAGLGSRAFGAGRVQPWTALSLAAIVGLLTAPQMLHDLSFQLSFLAVAGMLLLLPPWLDRLGVGQGSRGGSAANSMANLAKVAANADSHGTGSLGSLAAPELAALSDAAGRRLRTLLLSGLAVSVAAQLPSLSVVVGSFGVLPLLSPLVNVVAVPLASLLVPLGFVAGMAGLIAEPLARLVNMATQPLASGLIALANYTAGQPKLAWGQVSWLGHVCWAAFFVAVCAWARHPGRLKHTALVAVVAAGVAWAVPAATPPPDVWFLDVGQGDATLVRLPGGAGLLIDGGGSPFSDFDVGNRIVVPALRALGVTRLAAVVATHPDADHIEGLLAVLQNVPVGMLVTGPPDPASVLDRQLRALADQKGIAVHQAVRGQRLVVHVGRGSALRLDVLNPPARTAATANERSVAMALYYDDRPLALLLGDIGLATEPDLAVPPAPLLMVPHHGSRGSTGPQLVRAASPTWAVISVGRNQYGHPSPEVVEGLEEAGVLVLTTLESGAVRFDLRRPHLKPEAMVRLPAESAFQGAAAPPQLLRLWSNHVRQNERLVTYP